MYIFSIFKYFRQKIKLGFKTSPQIIKKIERKVFVLIQNNKIYYFFVFRKIKNCRKDTGYSTGSSHTSAKMHKNRYKKNSKSRENSSENKKSSKQKLKRSDQETKGKRRLEEAFSEESESDLSPIEKKEETKRTKKRSYEKEPTISLSSDPSSE